MKSEELILKIEATEQKLIHQIETRNNGFSGSGTTEELKFILQELTKLKESLRTGEIPPENKRRLSSSKIVTGAWEINDPLGEEILEIDYIYKYELDNN